MKKISYVIIFLIIFIGNKNYIELNNLAIITNISIVKEKENYKVTFQEIIPKREDNKVVKILNTILIQVIAYNMLFII